MAATGYAGGDPTRVAKVGDTMTGPLVLPGDPVAPTQAADKHYVDTAIAGASGAVVSVNGRTGAVVLTAADIAPVAEIQVTGLVADLAGKVPLALATAKGDVLVATGSGVLARVPVGSNSQVLVADSTQTTGVKWTTPAALPKFVEQFVITGNVTMPNTSGAWQLLQQASGPLFELDIPAVVGDLVEVNVRAMRDDSNSSFVDFVTMTGTTPAVARYLASGSSTPASEGDSGWYGQNAFILQSGAIKFSAQSVDIDGTTGGVRIGIAVRAGGTSKLYAVASNPFRWNIENRGQHT